MWRENVKGGKSPQKLPVKSGRSPKNIRGKTKFETPLARGRGKILPRAIPPMRLGMSLLTPGKKMYVESRIRGKKLPLSLF